jgi:NTE family protein
MADTNGPTSAPPPKEYVAAPKSARTGGLALCLSGGGYRAALFHLGTLRRLNELGAVGKVDAVSSVSGGSIFAAHFAMCLAAGKLNSATGRFDAFDADVAGPFRVLVNTDIRTSPALRRLLPWEWFNAGASSEGLEAQYEAHLTQGMKLRDLPARPRFHFCSTDMAFGVNWVFTRDSAGDYQAGSLPAATAGELPLARAVAASSCFPPVFKPMPMRLDPRSLTGGRYTGSDRADCVSRLALTDGGVYDNMGLEPVWKSATSLLVSDGGAPFRMSKNTDDPHQLLRINDIMGNQAEALRKRWLIASFVRGDYGGTYWGVKSDVADYPRPAGTADDRPRYSPDLVAHVISAIRTDMDRFSDAEVAVLENHGYLLADAAVRAHVPDLHDGSKPSLPHPNWGPSAEAQIREALKDSGHVHPFGH